MPYRIAKELLLHFTEKKTGSENLNNLPIVSQLVNGGTGISTQDYVALEFILGDIGLKALAEWLCGNVQHEVDNIELCSGDMSGQK